MNTNTNTTNTWNGLLFTADQLIQSGKLTETQIKKILPLVELKKVINHNKLSDNFIRNNIEPLIEMQDSDDEEDHITLTDVYKIQKYNYK
jgi:hypothetical protein